jgi:RND family efflux transporter MFP subunit
MKRKIVAIIVIAGLIAAGAALVIIKKKALANLPKPAAQIPAVATAPAVEGQLDVTSRQLGEIQPYLQSDLASRITGNILSISKREGDRVAKGEVVATIDDRELLRKLEASSAEVLATRERFTGAQSLYETQRSVTERDEKLYAAGAISKEALERSRSALASAKAAANAYRSSINGLEQNAEVAKLQVEYAGISAPFDGIVTRRWVEPGDLAAPGKPILTIQKAGPVKVIVQIPQEMIGQARPGTKIVLYNAAETMNAAVTKVYPALGRNLLGSAEIVLPKSPFGLPPGSTVAVDVVTSTVKGVIVPENAVVRTDKGAFLYLVNDGTVHIRPIEVLGTGKGNVVVKGNVAAGSRVAVAQENKLLALSDGMRVTAGGGQ